MKTDITRNGMQNVLLNLDKRLTACEEQQVPFVTFGDIRHPGMTTVFGGEVVSKSLAGNAHISAIVGSKAHESGTILRTFENVRGSTNMFGVLPQPTTGDPLLTPYPGANATNLNGLSYYTNGSLYQGGAAAGYLPACTPGSIVQIELNMDAKTVRFALNGIWGATHPLRVNAPHYIVVNIHTYGDSVKILREHCSG